MEKTLETYADVLEVDVVTPVATKVGLLDKVKETMNPTTLGQKFNLNKETLIEMGMYLGIGFVVGFLLKKYSTFVTAFALGITGLFALQYLGVLSIVVDWQKMQQVFGIQQVAMPDASLLQVYWGWIKLNVKLVVSFSVGFFVGLKAA